jgi:hypothetical protein
VLIRADTGGGTQEFLAWLSKPGRRLPCSVGFTITEAVAGQHYWSVGVRGPEVSCFGGCQRKRISMPRGMPRVWAWTHVSWGLRTIPTCQTRSLASSVWSWSLLRRRRWAAT